MICRSTDLRLIPIDQQFTDGLVSVIDQIGPKRITWEEYERHLREHPTLGEAFGDVVRKLRGMLTKIEGWKP